MKTAMSVAVVALVLLSISAVATSQNACDPTCSLYATCNNGTCECDAGFTGNGTTCVDINECELDMTCGENANCSNTDGSSYCYCNYGFSGDPYNGCEDIEECEYTNCTENAYCVNTPGSFSCECNPGYTGYGFSFCYDVDECENNPCNQFADCDNTEGSYTCRCRGGYTGNGTSCTSLCAMNCGGNAECVEADEVMFECECQDGYDGDPTQNCEDINECETGRYCQSEYITSCNNTEGSYSCSCRDGFYYSRIVDDCIEFDGEEPYRLEAQVVPGCNEELNAIYRQGLQYKVQAFILEYFYNKRQYNENNSEN